MEDFHDLLTFHESVDELRQKIQYMTCVLEMTRNETNEEIRKNNEHIKKLVQLLQAACKERDEAKAQLKKVEQIMSFNKIDHNFIDHHQFVPTTNTIAVSSAFPAAPFSPDSPLLTPNFATKTSSPITDSSSFSFETHTNNNNFTNHPQCHVSSPAASSPDSSNIAFSSATATVSAASPIVRSTTAVKPATKEVDRESLIIATLAKRKALPQKGRLLQAVLEAGPLLSTLMVAGSLPQWRNPPGLLTHQIPPVNLKGCGGMLSQSPGDSKFCTPQQLQRSNNIIMHDVSSASFVKGMAHSSMYNGSHGFCPSSMLDFGNGSSGSSCLMGGRMMSNPAVSFDSQIHKRQRIV